MIQAVMCSELLLSFSTVTECCRFRKDSVKIPMTNTLTSTNVLEPPLNGLNYWTTYHYDQRDRKDMF